MHDPMSVAFQIPNPFARHYNPEARKIGDPFAGAWSRRPPLITVWHIDPESDGTDSSCQHADEAHGWTERAEKQARDMAAWSETDHGERYFTAPSVPHVVRLDGGREELVFDAVSPGDALGLTLAAFRTIAWQLEQRELSLRHLRAAIDLGSFLDTAQLFAPSKRGEDRVATFRHLIRAYLRVDRPWWRNWRLHLWHWRVQVHPLQDLLRWWRERREPDPVEVVAGRAEQPRSDAPAEGSA